MNIYHYHIQKTGGSTINFSFLNIITDDPQSLYIDIHKKHNFNVKIDGKRFICWNTQFINSGDYFYGWSHISFNNLNVPKHVKTITCFRDPIERVISFYNELDYFKKTNNQHPCMGQMGKWLDGDFSYFLEQITKDNLMNQLYLFSSNYNINEAFENIKKVDFILFNETLDVDLNNLFNKLGLELKSKLRIKTYTHEKLNISESDKLKLREMLDDEYKLLEMVKNIK